MRTSSVEVIKHALTTAYNTGSALSSMRINEADIQRIEMCRKVAARFAKNPMMNVSECLEYVFHRSPSQIYRDKIIIDHIINLQYGDTERSKAKFVADHYAKQLIRIGEQTGDWKPIDKGLSHYTKIHGLDRDAPADDVTSNTASLPVVFTADVHAIDPDRERISSEQRRKLLEQYGATEDQISSLIDREKQRILSADNAEYITPEEGDTPSPPATVPSVFPESSTTVPSVFPEGSSTVPSVFPEGSSTVPSVFPEGSSAPSPSASPLTP